MAKESEADKLVVWFSEQGFDVQKELLGRLEKAHGEAVEGKRAELLAQLQALGGVPLTKRKGPNKGGTVAIAYRGPNGEAYSGRGALPKWARELGVTDREGLEKYRVK